MTDLSQNRDLKEARDRFAELTRYTTDMTNMVDFVAGQIREKLAKAGTDATALGFKTAAEGEAEIERRRLDCALRSARKMYRDYLSDSSPRETNMVAYARSQIEKMAAHAGKSLAAVDELGNSEDRDIRDRLEATGRAILRLTARKMYKEFTEGNTASFADQLDYHRKKIAEHVDAAGFGWADLDPAAGSEAAVKEKMEAGARRACLLHARKMYAEFRLTPTAWGEHMIEYHVNKIKENLRLAGADAAALDEEGKTTATEMERRIDGIAERARFVNLLRPFEEAKAAPATLKELWGKLEPLREQFDRARSYFDPNDPALAPLAQRFDEASRKARDHACEQEGVVPVLKTLRFGQKVTGNS